MTRERREEKERRERGKEIFKGLAIYRGKERGGRKEESKGGSKVR